MAGGGTGSRGSGAFRSSGGGVVDVSSIQFRTWSEVGDCLGTRNQANYRTYTTPGQDTILQSGLRFIRVPPPGHAGPWNPVEHAAHRLLMWRGLLGEIAFKIGIASDARDRYFNPEFGYVREDTWHFMDVVLEGRADDCRQLEIDLIRAFRGVPGCQNERPGGEGVNPTRTHMCTVYLVVAGAGLGVSLKAACLARRKRLQTSSPEEPAAKRLRMSSDRPATGG